MNISEHTLSNLNNLGNVPAGYAHHDCWVGPSDLLELPGAILKWYNIGRPGVITPPSYERDGRTFLLDLAQRESFDFGHGLGWVLLHDCVATTFLIVGVWNDANECRHTIFARAPFSTEPEFRPLMMEGQPKPMACVWELTPIWHERNAWSRYLYSNRDLAAKTEYVRDQFSGTA